MAQDNVDVIEGAWAAIRKRDLDAAASVVAPEAEITAPSTLPWGGTYMGPEGFREFLRGLLSYFKDFKASPEKVLGADDEHVIVVAAIRGRTSDGTPVENRAVWVYKLRGGQVAAAEVFVDTAQVLKMLDSTAAS